MQSAQDIVTFLKGRQTITALLRAVEALNIDDCWIGAGLIRNAVWDHLHGLPIGLVGGTDVDVIFCDHTNPSLDTDLAIEHRLASRFPRIPWSVRNQARMHERNDDAPYLNSEDAIRCWPETATAVAARLSGRDLEIIAPHGVADLVGMIVRPSPAFTRKMAMYERRLASKEWARRWPRLKFVTQ